MLILLQTGGLCLHYVQPTGIAGRLLRIVGSDALEPLNPALGESDCGESETSAARAAHRPSGPTGIPLSLAANFRWAFAGNVVYAACQWAMLSVLARLGTAEAVGQFVLGLSIAAPIMALTMLQLRSVQVTDVHEAFTFADYFGTRIVWTIAGLIAIVVCASVGGEDRGTFWVVVLVGMMKGVDSMSDIVRGLFQHRERMDLSGISLMVKGPPSLLALAVVMGLTGSVVLASAAMAVVWVVSFATYDLFYANRLLAPGVAVPKSGKQIRPRFRLGVMGRLTWTAFPLGIVMAVISLQINIPRYVLQSCAGSKLLGYFGAIVYPMMAGMMVTTAMGQSASPRLARYFAEDLTAFVRLLSQLSGISAALAIAMIVGTYAIGDRVLWLLYGAEYTAYYREFVVVVVAWGLQLVSSCWGYGLTAARHFRTQVGLTGASCVATVGAAFVFIPRYGVMGAALSVLVTSVAMAIGYAVAVFWAVRAKRRQGVS